MVKRRLQRTRALAPMRKPPLTPRSAFALQWRSDSRSGALLHRLWQERVKTHLRAPHSTLLSMISSRLLGSPTHGKRAGLHEPRAFERTLENGANKLYRETAARLSRDAARHGIHR